MLANINSRIRKLEAELKPTPAPELVTIEYTSPWTGKVEELTMTAEQYERFSKLLRKIYGPGGPGYREDDDEQERESEICGTSG